MRILFFFSFFLLSLDIFYSFRVGEGFYFLYFGGCKKKKKDFFSFVFDKF